MNRSIKFRVYAKTDSGPKMVYLDPLQCDNGLWFSSKEHIDNYDGKVMEFIGLQDKNGRDIYESDIVRVSEYNPVSEKYEESLAIICWRYCGFVTIHPKNLDEKWCGGSEICDTAGLEVVGNIFENSNLINL